MSMVLPEIRRLPDLLQDVGEVAIGNEEAQTLESENGHGQDASGLH